MMKHLEIRDIHIPARALVLALFFVPLSVYGGDKLLFMIRVDDILSRNTTILPRSIRPFQDTVESRGAKVTWAVIPHRIIESSNTDGTISRELRETVARGHEVVLHGYNHICIRCGNSGHEMYCTTQQSALTFAEQETLIISGMKILRDSTGIVPAGFVPPGHHADSTTYQVLLDRSIPWISTTGTTKQEIYKALYNLSPHAEYTWAMTSSGYLTQLKSALQDVRSSGLRDGYYCLLLHDYFIRKGYEGGIVLRWVGELLDSLKQEYGDRIEFSTIVEGAKKLSAPTRIQTISNNHAPTQVQLHQNFPNPFNPNTTISYVLKEAGHVSLNIYDSRGALVRELQNQYATPGIYMTTLSAQNLPSGVYYYVLRARGEQIVRKALLTR